MVSCGNGNLEIYGFIVEVGIGYRLQVTGREEGKPPGLLIQNGVGW